MTNNYGERADHEVDASIHCSNFRDFWLIGHGNEGTKSTEEKIQMLNSKR